MKKVFLFLALMSAAAYNMPAMAESNEVKETESASKTATIRGRVLDVNKNILTGAVIYIGDQGTGSVSDVDGYYTITNVKPGKHTVETSYVGYATGYNEIEAHEGETLVYEIVLNEGMSIDEVVVTSPLQGQHRAINTQKNALNMVDVVSSDQAGKYPDSNIGDALKRISGINVQYDQGEARFGQVRGTPADMSSVTVNGTRLPSAEGETRSVQLDLIPTDMIQTIEVSKVITPDMEADAIGGSINLVTKNSPSKQVITATVGSGYNMVSNKPQAKFGVTYGDKLSDKFGYMFSLSYENSPIGSDNTEFEWGGDVDDAYVKEMQIRQYYVQRERQSYSAAFNWDMNENNKIFFNGLYNRRNDWENRYKTKVKMNSDGDLKEVGIETKGGSEDEKFTRLEQQQTMTFTLGGEHLIGSKLLMDWGGTLSAASEARPNESYIAYAIESDEEEIDGEDEYIYNIGTVNMNYDNMRQPFAENGGELLTLDAIMRKGIGEDSKTGELDELSRSQQMIEELDYSAYLNFKYDITGGSYASSVKFGGKYATKSKKVDVSCYEYKKGVEDTFDAIALDNTMIADRAGFMQGEEYNFGREFVTREFLGNFDFASTDYEEKLSEAAENYEASETVAAGYLRYDQKLGREFSLMAGVRAEATYINNSGYEYLDKQDELNPTGEKSSNYLNVLPSVLLKWEPSDEVKVRASYTNSIARPKYSDLVNNIITDKYDEIKFGNPDLKASLSHNADLSADYYFKSLGLVRGGLFFKQINDFIVDERKTPEGGNEYAGKYYYLSKKPVNAGNATLLGAEVALSRDFGFISPSLRSFGFATTYTYTHSDATLTAIEGREDEKMSLPGSPEHTANASIYFEKAGFTARVSYNYASSFIDELGDEIFEDRYYDSVNYLDFNMNYRFKEHYNLYADVSNIMNQPLRYYQGSKELTMQSEYYGIRFNIGLKVNF